MSLQTSPEEGVVPFQRIINGSSPFYYMIIELEFEEEMDEELTAAQFKAVLLHAFSLMFGEVGQASFTIDLLKYRPSKREAYVRVNASSFVKFWAALTLFSEYGGRTCAFRVNQVSGHLMALASNSRNFVHTPLSTGK